jgi:hypothetical protein
LGTKNVKKPGEGGEEAGAETAGAGAGAFGGASLESSSSS